MSEYEVFSGPCFAVSRPEKTPYSDIFHAAINPLFSMDPFTTSWKH